MTDVLFVDDNADSRELFDAMFQRENVSVVTLESGTDALQWLNGNSVRVIVLDLSMPVMDGLSTVKEIRRNEQLLDHDAATIAFMTGQVVDDSILNVAVSEGVKRIFIKAKDDWGDIVAQIKEWVK